MKYNIAAVSIFSIALVWIGRIDFGAGRTGFKALKMLNRPHTLKHNSRVETTKVDRGRTAHLKPLPQLTSYVSYVLTRRYLTDNPCVGTV